MQRQPKGLVQLIQRAWYAKNPGWLWFLWPLESLYRLIIQIRLCAYHFKLLKSTKFELPVWVIGNLTVGGTGKTPLTIWIAKWLLAKGYTPGIILRGYAADSNLSDKQPIKVSLNDDPRKVGDEALLYANYLPKTPIYVHPERVQSIQAMLDAETVDLILSDDGLQHYSMARDFELIIQDQERQIGNGHMLPVGPLREPPSRLETVDLSVMRCEQLSDAETDLPAFEIKIAQWLPLNPTAVPLDKALSEAQEMLILAGIGNPAPFLSSTEAFALKHNPELMIEKRAYTDHYAYQAKDFSHLPDKTLILMTEKDAVKCRGFTHLNIYVSIIELKPNQKLIEKIENQVQNLKMYRH